MDTTIRTRLKDLNAQNRDSAALLETKFCEKLDCLVAASQDSNIYLWGFESSAVDALCKMTEEDEDEDEALYEKYRKKLQNKVFYIKYFGSRPRTSGYDRSGL